MLKLVLIPLLFISTNALWDDSSSRISQYQIHSKDGVLRVDEAHFLPLYQIHTENGVLRVEQEGHRLVNSHLPRRLFVSHSHRNEEVSSVESERHRLVNLHPPRRLFVSHSHQNNGVLNVEQGDRVLINLHPPRRLVQKHENVDLHSILKETNLQEVIRKIIEGVKNPNQLLGDKDSMDLPESSILYHAVLKAAMKGRAYALVSVLFARLEGAVPARFHLRLALGHCKHAFCNVPGMSAEFVDDIGVFDVKLRIEMAPFPQLRVVSFERLDRPHNL